MGAKVGLVTSRSGRLSPALFCGSGNQQFQGDPKKEVHVRMDPSGMIYIYGDPSSVEAGRFALKAGRNHSLNPGYFSLNV